MPLYDFRCQNVTCSGKLDNFHKEMNELRPSCPLCGASMEVDFSNSSFVDRVSPSVGNEKKYPAVIKNWLDKRHDQERRKGNL
jgi:hypothetical protein